MTHALLVRYNEIHLKGLNRPYFENRLVANIKEALGKLPHRVERISGRIIIWDAEEAEAVSRLTKVFGIHSVSVARVTEKDYAQMAAAALALAGEVLEKRGPYTFKVHARRADKRFSMNSSEINRELGKEILDAHPGLSVDVHTPDVLVGVEVRERQAFIYAGEIMGAGGMPLGTNGLAALLLSGGIDSPVAGHMIARRGTRLIAVHFFSFPYTGERAKEKVLELTKQLCAYAGEIALFVVGFTKIQQTIFETCPNSQMTVLMRRMMMRIAERIAREQGASALVTGESIGQVASQTIEALAATDDAVTMPVFRPLIGFDKNEIIARAQAIRTFETSILPYEDCCTVFVPRHPVTHPKLEMIRASEALLDVDALVDDALANTEKMMIRFID